MLQQQTRRSIKSKLDIIAAKKNVIVHMPKLKLIRNRKESRKVLKKADEELVNIKCQNG